MMKLQKFGLCHCMARFREHRRNLVEDVESLVRAQITDVMVLMLVRLRWHLGITLYSAPARRLSSGSTEFPACWRSTGSRGSLYTMCPWRSAGKVSMCTG